MSAAGFLSEVIRPSELGSVCGPTTGKGHPCASRSLGITLRPLAPSMRSRVRAVYLARATAGFDRALLEQALFEVQDDLEHRSPRHPQVEVLSAVRDVLLDDLRVNESRDGMRWPAVERAAGIMRQKRRVGRTNAFSHLTETQNL